MSNAIRTRTRKRKRCLSPKLIIENLNNPVAIKYYDLTPEDNPSNPSIKIDNIYLKNIFDYDKLEKIPNRIYKLRGVLEDFNKILQKEQYINSTYLSQTQKITKDTSKNGKKHFEFRDKIHAQYNNMCFYCGKTISQELKTIPGYTECDHVISIMQMLVSLKVDSNILLNFETVHKACNQEAKQDDICTIWGTIGSQIYTQLDSRTPYAIDEINNEQDIDKQQKLNIQWCRGYLSKMILQNLIINDNKTQKARIKNIKNSIDILDIAINKLEFLISDPITDAGAADILVNMSTVLN
jgi:hypothetical protein